MVDHAQVDRELEKAEAVHAAQRAVHRARRFAPAADAARSAVLREAYEICSELGYSQRQTAELLGLSKSTLNRILRGESDSAVVPPAVHAEAVFLAQRAWSDSGSDIPDGI